MEGRCRHWRAPCHPGPTSPCKCQTDFPLSKIVDRGQWLGDDSKAALGFTHDSLSEEQYGSRVYSEQPSKDRASRMAAVGPDALNEGFRLVDRRESAVLL